MIRVFCPMKKGISHCGNAFFIAPPFLFYGNSLPPSGQCRQQIEQSEK
jgi:hypothetical protein